MQRKTDNTVDIATAASLLGVSQRHVRRLCRSGKLAGSVWCGQGWDIPRTADVRLCEAKSPQPRSASLNTASIPPDKLQTAVWRRGIIEQCEEQCATFVREGGTRSVAMAVFSKQAGVPVRTLQRWRQRVKDRGLTGLIDSRGRGNSFGPVISPDAWNEFLGLYLDEREPTVKSCWQMIGFVNQQQQHGWTIPSLRTMQQYINEHIPKPVSILHRKGLNAFLSQCAPYIEKDIDSVEPGAVWIGDHHQCDCWVRYRNRWIRPWLTAWEDMRSRAIVGAKVTVSPNSTTILQAMRDGVERFGPPDSVLQDNGKDYDCQMFTGMTKTVRITKRVRTDEPLAAGLYAMMGVGVQFALPYNAQAKAIERLFGTVESQFFKTFKTYCGKDTISRPEALFDYMATQKAIDEAMDFDEFVAAFEAYRGVYNQTVHTGKGMDGRSPMQVLSQRTSRRVMADGVMDLLLRNWTPEAVVGKNGVTVRGLRYGQYDTSLLMHQGRKVRCTYEPDDMSRVSVYAMPSYQLLTIAEQNQLVGYGTAAGEADVREAMAARSRARRTVRNYKPAARVAAMNLTDLTIAAMRDRTVETDPPDQAATLRPVATAMDGNVKLHRQLVNQKKVRRAAGADGITHVVDLQLDQVDAITPDDFGMDLDLNFERTDEGQGIDLKLYE